MKNLKKVAILVGASVCVAAGTRAEAAAIYNESGAIMEVYQVAKDALTIDRTKLVIWLRDHEKKPQYTIDSGAVEKGINWTGRDPVIIVWKGTYNAVLCPNSDNDFQGGNYLRVSIDNGYIIATMYDSDNKQLWRHTTTK